MWGQNGHLNLKCQPMPVIEHDVVLHGEKKITRHAVRSCQSRDRTIKSGHVWYIHLEFGLKRSSVILALQCVLPH